LLKNIHKQPKIHRKIHTSQWILKPKPKVSRPLPNVCDFQNKHHTLGYGFKNLSKIYSLAYWFIFCAISISFSLNVMIGKQLFPSPSPTLSLFPFLLPSMLSLSSWNQKRRRSRKAFLAAVVLWLQEKKFRGVGHKQSKVKVNKVLNRAEPSLGWLGSK
jgi:hypothetical protein